MRSKYFEALIAVGLGAKLKEIEEILGGDTELSKHVFCNYHSGNIEELKKAGESEEFLMWAIIRISYGLPPDKYLYETKYKEIFLAFYHKADKTQKEFKTYMEAKNIITSL